MIDRKKYLKRPSTQHSIGFVEWSIEEELDRSDRALDQNAVNQHYAQKSR